MRTEKSFRSILLATTIALGILPLRPLVLAVGLNVPGLQQCLLHGANCRCIEHCERTTRHQHEAREVAATPACHRNAKPGAQNGASQPGNDAPASQCAMASCGKETPLLLTAENLPCLSAIAATEISNQFRTEPLKASPQLNFLSVDTSPPTPPPQA